MDALGICCNFMSLNLCCAKKNIANTKAKWILSLDNPSVQSHQFKIMPQFNWLYFGACFFIFPDMSNCLFVVE